MRCIAQPTCTAKRLATTGRKGDPFSRGTTTLIGTVNPPGAELNRWRSVKQIGRAHV
jgi:hypothetical protein